MKLSVAYDVETRFVLRKSWCSTCSCMRKGVDTLTNSVVLPALLVPTVTPTSKSILLESVAEEPRRGLASYAAADASPVV